jgi:ATP-dependent 26S proteasome regulatory subunit
MLDSALLRPGRIDRQFEIGHAKDPELLRFYQAASAYHALPPWEQFRAQLPQQCTLADAQNLAFRLTRKELP